MKTPKTVTTILLLAIFAAVASQDAIFLHHSTGSGVYVEGKVASWITDYNTANGTNHQVTDRLYPNTPYPWNNYPYDYWNLWINGECDNADADIECLGSLCAAYDVIIYKHCFPGAAILADDASPSISSSKKTLANYKLQYQALRDLMDSYPDNKFIVWTLAPLHRLATNAENAARARQFVDWVKSEWLTEDGKDHPNIFIFDFYSYVVESDPNPETGVYNCLKYEYEYLHDLDDSHPNRTANKYVGPFFAQFIVDVIEGEMAVKVSGITVSGTATITTQGGTTQLTASIVPEDASNKAVTWSIQNGTGEASISPSGLVTAISNGTVTATATAADGSGVSGSLVITIAMEAVMVSAIVVYGEDFAVTLPSPGSTLQMHTSVVPAEATDKSVTWSVENGTGQATISQEGLLTASANGMVTARATANDGSGVSGILNLEIGEQVPTGTGEPGEEPFVVSTIGTEIQIEFTNTAAYDQIRIYDLRGNLVLTEKLADAPYRVDIAPLPSGMYIMQLVGRDGKTEGVKVSRM